MVESKHSFLVSLISSQPSFVCDLLVWIPLGLLVLYPCSKAVLWTYSILSSRTQLTKPTETCGVQTRPNCSGGFKRHAGLVCVVGKRSLQQEEQEDANTDSVLFTLFTQMSIVLPSANHMTPGHSLLIMVVLDLYNPIVTNTVTGSCTHAHTMDRLLSQRPAQKPLSFFFFLK